jgi:hypothetical protein
MAKVEFSVRAEEASDVAGTSTPVGKKKRRSGLTVAGRDKLSALMKARWAAKRAGTAPASVARRAEA